jgi:hypothetical protein
LWWPLLARCSRLRNGQQSIRFRDGLTVETWEGINAVTAMGTFINWDYEDSAQQGGRGRSRRQHRCGKLYPEAGALNTVVYAFPVIVENFK